MFRQELSGNSPVHLWPGAERDYLILSKFNPAMNRRTIIGLSLTGQLNLFLYRNFNF
jgi:hypothetical protein